MNSCFIKKPVFIYSVDNANWGIRLHVHSLYIIYKQLTISVYTDATRITDFQK
jgi:hypothetical protein